jgi:MFS family permease
MLLYLWRRLSVTDSSTPVSVSTSLALRLAPIMGSVFLAFLVIGLALPALPLHVHDTLGLGGLAVGTVAGAQFAASLVSRVWAGGYADTRGAKRAVLYGLVATVASGVIYLVSLRFTDHPVLSASVLVFGRAVLGGAESFVITGAVSWALALGGPGNTGRVIAWIGTAMYAAFAVGAPIGGWLQETYGFAAVAAATAIVPLAALVAVASLPSVPGHGQAVGSMRRVVSAIWMPGIGLAMSSLGFGAMMTFAALLFAERGWEPAWLAVTAFAVSFIAARLAFGHLADRHGGARVALACLLVEAAGLALVWIAPSKAVAVVGAVLTGFGYSLVYPGFGVEAVRRAPPHSRGLAMGTYTAFLDLALGVTSPVLGFLAGRSGTGRVFLVSAIVVLLATGVATWLRRHPASA